MSEEKNYGQSAFEINQRARAGPGEDFVLPEKK